MSAAFAPPPPRGGLLQTLERLMREGGLPDPRTTSGSVLYIAFGLAVGLLIGGMA
jgi:hypothetical protein